MIVGLDDGALLLLPFPFPFPLGTLLGEGDGLKLGFTDGVTLGEVLGDWDLQSGWHTEGQ